MGTALAPSPGPDIAGDTQRTGLDHAATAAVALAVTTFVAVNPGGWSPFVTARWWCVSTLAALTGALALRAVRRDPTPLLATAARRAWAVLLLALCAAAVSHGDVPTGLLGEPARHLGLVTWLLCALVFVAGAALGAGPDGARRRRAVAVGLTAATTPTGTWCLAELIGGPPIDVAVTTDRLLGPFGSAAYLGAACCLGLPVSFALAVDRASGRLLRIVALGATATGTVALVGSGSRAAWCALLATAVLAVAALVHRRTHRDRRAAQPSAGIHRPGLVAAVAAGALGAGVVAFLAIGPGLGAVLDRDHGATSRLDEWRVALDVLAQHPLGIGPEGYRIAIADGVDDAYERRYDRDDALPDRAHSGPLDVALAGGVLAGIAWLVLQAHVARRCWRALRPGAERDPAGLATAGLAAGVVAYGLGQLLLFPIGEIDPVWWLLAGAIVAADPSLGSGRPLRRAVSTARAATATVAGVVAVVAGLAGVAGVAADRLAGDAVRHAHSDPTRAQRDAERAVQLRPDDTHLRLLAATSSRATSTVADIDRAIAQARAARSYSPHDPEVREVLGLLLLDRAVTTGSADDVAAAVEHWEAATAADPHRADWQLALGRARALAGDAPGARTAWERAAALDPDDPRPPALLAGLTAVGDDG